MKKETLSNPEATETLNGKQVASDALLSRVCQWLDHNADQEMKLAEKLASFRIYQDAVECERKAKIYRLVKRVIEEAHAEIQSENGLHRPAGSECGHL